MQADLSNDFVFDSVLFFGRSLSEYIQMFDLELDKLKESSILDCAAGPASFTAEALEQGFQVMACDPRYGTTVDDLGAINSMHMLEVMSRQPAAAHLFEKNIVTLDPEFQKNKKKSLLQFVSDYECGYEKGRYVQAALPELPFADRSFSLCLSSNFLFLYSDYAEGGMLKDSPFDYDFHLQSILEMTRVANEVRLYPLKGPHRKIHSYLASLMEDLSIRGYRAELVPVRYRDVKDAHHMLKIQPSAC